MNLEVAGGHKVLRLKSWKILRVKSQTLTKEKHQPPVSKDIMWIRRILQSGSRIRILCRILLHWTAKVWIRILLTACQICTCVLRFAVVLGRL